MPFFLKRGEGERRGERKEEKGRAFQYLSL